ncbi:MAG: hypothetical protein R3Y47_03315 [Lachnospiraceae bacterium]
MYLCQGKVVTKSFYIDSIAMSIDSLEGLVLVLVKKQHAVDRKFFSKELIQWLDQECGQNDLAFKLFDYTKRKKSFIECMELTLRYVGYISDARIEELIFLFEQGEQLSEIEKSKLDADRLVQEGKYSDAMFQYGCMLEELPEAESFMRSCLLHNMGVLYSYMFQFLNAYQAFRQAYALAPTDETLFQMLFSARLGFEEKEYLEIVTATDGYYQISLQVEDAITQYNQSFQHSKLKEELSQLEEWKDYGSEEGFYIATGRVVRKLTEEYYRNYI